MAGGIEKLVAMVAAELGTLAGVTWGTAPTAVWYPDLERAELKRGGLTALVIPVDATPEPVTRGRLGSQRGLSVHVAVIQPISDGTLAEGGVPVESAELIVEQFLQRRVANEVAWAVCMEAKLEPIVSAEYAKQYGLWVSYVKLEFGFNRTIA